MEKTGRSYVLCVGLTDSDLVGMAANPAASDAIIVANEADALVRLTGHQTFDSVVLSDATRPDRLIEIITTARTLKPAPAVFVPADQAELRAFIASRLNPAGCVEHPKQPDRRAHPAPASRPSAVQRESHSGVAVLPTGAKINLLVVEDDESYVPFIKSSLAHEGFNVRLASNGHEALDILHHEGAQIIICDLHMPGMGGIELCQTVRASDAFGFAYIIMMTSKTDKRFLIESFDAGVDDFLCKPFDEDELLVRVRAGQRIIQLEADSVHRNHQILKQHAELAALTAKLERLAITDDLTGLLNRRQAVQKLEELWKLSARYNVPLSSMILDIDHFKKFNDTYGHALGDDVLRLVGDVMTRTIRSVDVVARLGGEEFVIFCPNTKIDGAMILANRVRENIENEPIAHEGQTLTVTASLGVAQHNDSVKTPDDLLKLADRALYEAKGQGRNRAVAAEPAAAVAG